MVWYPGGLGLGLGCLACDGVSRGALSRDAYYGMHAYGMHAYGMQCMLREASMHCVLAWGQAHNWWHANLKQISRIQRVLAF